MNKVIRDYTHGWLGFGKLGITFFKDFVKNLTGFLMWVPCFIFYPICNRIINRNLFRKRKYGELRKRY